MGVYINMEMPKTGRYFVAVDYIDGKNKTVISVMSEFERGDKTRPLLAVHEVIPVPPHWRLGDLDALKETIKVDPATCPAVGYCQQATPPTTNADRIRAMSDEELADWLVMNGNGEDYKTWFDWLRQEAQDG